MQVADSGSALKMENAPAYSKGTAMGATGKIAFWSGAGIRGQKKANEEHVVRKDDVFLVFCGSVFQVLKSKKSRFYAG